MATIVRTALFEGSHPRAVKENQRVRDWMISCVNRGMQILSESGWQSVVYFLKSEYNLTIEQAVENPQRFILAQKEIFGLGAKLLEKAVLEELYLTISSSEESNPLCKAFIDMLEEDLKDLERNGAGIGR
ncbi:MAG: DUF3227 domain-containing protein [Thaumarchaeota archaeon]|nr:DUF3227 domain-containing protein [Nitrososphaerota archaeon]